MEVYNNLKIELMQWQAHRARRSLFDNEKNCSLNFENKSKRFEV